MRKRTQIPRTTYSDSKKDGRTFSEKLEEKIIQQNLLRYNKPGNRECLGCGKILESDGYHNRFHTKCKEGIEEYSPLLHKLNKPKPLTQQ